MTDDPASFDGFSLPDGAWLPPEILHLLPQISTLAELKILIAAIYETMSSRGPAVISLGDFQALTGLSRKAVSRGIQAAIKRGTLRRHPAAGTYIYHLHTILPDTPPPSHRGTTPLPAADKTTHKQVTSAAPEATTAPSSTETSPDGATPAPHVLHECNNGLLHPDQSHADGVTPPLPSPERLALIREMRSLGVALKVALNIAGRYEPEYLTEKLQQCRFAIERKLAHNSAGWFVASVRQDWQPPLGYDPVAFLSPEEQRHRYATGEYADLIQS